MYSVVRQPRVAILGRLTASMPARRFFSTPTTSDSINARIKKESLRNKVCQAEDTIQHFKDGQILGWSGFTGVGMPKVVPLTVARHVEKLIADGQGFVNPNTPNAEPTSPMAFHLFTGASTSSATEDVWAKLGMMRVRAPFQSGKILNKKLNTNQVHFFDTHLSKFPQQLMWGNMIKPQDKFAQPIRYPEGDGRARARTDGKIDVAIVEATAITPEGHIVPSVAVGASPELLHLAEKIIIEVNTALPDMTGLHDIPRELYLTPPNRRFANITRVADRVGSTAIPIDPSKIVAIVESKGKDEVPVPTLDPTAVTIAEHLIDFFDKEVARGFMPKNLLPLQSGIGNVANAVVAGLTNSKFSNLGVWTEVIQDSWLPAFLAGGIDMASTTSVRFSPDAIDKFFNNWDFFTKRIILRPQSIANLPGLINRLGVIAMNTPVEVDMYGHANSTHTNGGHMISGIGGSSDFMHNSFLSILHTPSVRPTKTDPTGISTIVPFVGHVDHTEHDVDIVVTEQGLADLRGLVPLERAHVIIERCAHPAYRPQLREYLEAAKNRGFARGSGHEPHMLESAFSMHINCMKNGTMKLPSWNFDKF